MTESTVQRSTSVLAEIIYRGNERFIILNGVEFPFFTKGPLAIRGAGVPGLFTLEIPVVVDTISVNGEVIYGPQDSAPDSPLPLRILPGKQD